MKIFLDTNIFLEYFEKRREYQAVSCILDAIEDGRLKAVISVGSVLTLTYLIRMELKRQGIYRPEQIEKLRMTLGTVLQMVSTAGLSHKNIITGTNDSRFDDIEDSLQYQCALQAKCDVLITINLRDYSVADTSKIYVLSPTEFVEKYL